MASTKKCCLKIIKFLKINHDSISFLNRGIIFNLNDRKFLIYIPVIDYQKSTCYIAVN